MSVLASVAIIAAIIGTVLFVVGVAVFGSGSAQRNPNPWLLLAGAATSWVGGAAVVVAVLSFISWLIETIIK